MNTEINTAGNVRAEAEKPDELTAKPLWQRLVEIGSKVPDEEWAKLPPDLARNFEHYMYGASQEE